MTVLMVTASLSSRVAVLSAHEVATLAGGGGDDGLIEGATWAILLVTVAIYAAGVREVWRRAGVGAGVRWREVVCFGAGLVTIGAATSSPLIDESAALFSAHMIQHALLMLVAAPLIVLGAPGVALSWAIAPRRPRWLHTVHDQFGPFWRWLTHPLVVFATYFAVLWLWHLPRLFEAALRHDAVHILQHASFLAAAALFWWGMVAGRYGRAGYGAAAVYVFLTTVHSGVLGALMVIAPSPWYSSYAGIDAGGQAQALADQQIAGLVMWVPSSIVFIGAGLALLAAWVIDSDRHAQRARSA